MIGVQADCVNLDTFSFLIDKKHLNKYISDESPEKVSFWLRPWGEMFMFTSRGNGITYKIGLFKLQTQLSNICRNWKCCVYSNIRSKIRVAQVEMCQLQTPTGF